jgi:hypothetical protein
MYYSSQKLIRVPSILCACVFFSWFFIHSASLWLCVEHHSYNPSVQLLQISAFLLQKLSRILFPHQLINPISVLHLVIEFVKVMNSNHKMEKISDPMLNTRIAAILLVPGSCQFNVSKFRKFFSKSCSSFLHLSITRRGAGILYVHLIFWSTIWFVALKSNSWLGKIYVSTTDSMVD